MKKRNERNGGRKEGKEAKRRERERIDKPKMRERENGKRED